MAVIDLPEGRNIRLGSVTLPSGKRIRAGDGSGQPVAWVTLEPLPDAGAAWAALSVAQKETGLVPILLSGLDGTPERPWDAGEFDDPADVTELEHMDPASVLREMWDSTAYEVAFDVEEEFFYPAHREFPAMRDRVTGDGNGQEEEEEEEEEDPQVVAMRAPFSKQFPGLAPAEDTPLGENVIQDVLGSLPPARLGLVAASRPADVLPLIGWIGVSNHRPTPLPIAAVLRSWEDRFGAKLLEVGFADIRLLAERPPRTHQAAQRLAAEQFAFCDECTLRGQVGLTAVGEITAGLVNTPIWGFWWD
jgi:hypothetical protein